MEVSAIIHILTGRAGTGKSQAIIEKIRENLETNENIITLVPEQFSYEFDQKLYHALGVSQFNRLQTHSFRSLAREISRNYGHPSDGMTYADDITRYTLLYQAVLYTGVQTHQLQMLEKQSLRPAFLIDLSTLFAQFRQDGITQEILLQKSAELSGRLGIKLCDILTIFQEYNALLDQHHLKDTESDLTTATAIANGQDAFLGDVFFLDEFVSFGEDEYEMLTYIFSACKDIYIALRTDNDDINPISLFSSVNDTLYRIHQIANQLHIQITITSYNTPHRFATDDLAHLSCHIFQTPQSYEKDTSHLHLMEALSPNEEVDFICTTIRHLLYNDSTLHCQDIAILTNQIDAYQSILEVAMKRYELPYHLDEKQSVRYIPLIVYLQTLLTILQRKKPSTELFIRLGKTGLTSCTIEEASTLENYCYLWQIDGDTWTKPFTGGDDAEFNENLRQKLFTPIEKLHKSCKGEQSGDTFCHTFYTFLEKMEIQQKQDEILRQYTNLEDRMSRTEEWTFTWNSMIDILEHMENLYTDVIMDFPQFCAIFAALLQNIQRAIPPQTLDAIFISDGKTARLNAPRVVFLIGVCEGIFPAGVSGSTLFSERDCERLETIQISVKKSTEVQIAQAQLYAYSQLTAPSQELYISYPFVDAMQQKCYPSSIFAQIQRLFPQIEIKSCASYTPNYYATTCAAAYVQYIQNYDKQSTELVPIRDILLQNPIYHERLESLSHIAQTQVGNVDAPLFHIDNTQRMRAHIGNTVTLSASSLERYQLCPFSYFCRDILRIRGRERIQLAGAESGNLVHTCLEQILCTHDRDAFLAMTPEEMHHEIDKYTTIYWEESLGGSFSKNGRELATYEHVVKNIFLVLRRLQEEFSQSAFIPRYFELMINSDNYDFPPLELTTKQGKVQLIGKVDRVDICQEKDSEWVRVVDYKTGVKNFSLGNLYYGIDMQMLIYLYTITAENTALSQAQPAGVLYMPASGIASDELRMYKVSPQKHYNETYQMHGILLNNAHVLKLMELDTQGAYVTGKLTSSNVIDEKSGIFLTKEQMEQMRTYVFDTLINTADNIYSGEIDANPLAMTGRDPCSYCIYDGVCGVNSTMRCRSVLSSSKATKAMIEILENFEEGK